MRVSVVIPTLNEGEAIGPVLRTLRTAADAANRTLFASAPLDWEYLIVDGASTDATADRARAEGARVVVESRRGYGRAYLTGFAEATGEVIATLDGDGTYPAQQVPEFVRYLLDRELDFLTMNRLAHLAHSSMTREHRIGNWVLNTFLRIAYQHYLKGLPGRGLEDSQSGMWVLRRSILPRLRLDQRGMQFSEEIKLEVILNGLRFEELPIQYAERWGAPKLSSWRDGRRNLLYLARKRLRVARETRGRAVLRLPSGHEPSGP